MKHTFFPIHRQIICLLLYVLLSKSGFTQVTVGGIKGTILTSDGKPAEAVSVQLKNDVQGKNSNPQGTITDDQGTFEFKKLKPGQYTLFVTLTGYHVLEQTATVSSGRITTLGFTLTATDKELQEVVVTSGKNKFATRKSESVARMPLNNLENPQAYTTIPKELLKEQTVTNFNDALKNSSGLDKLWTATGRAGDGAAYYSLRGFSTQPSVIDGIAGQTNGDLDPANIEKIEVIKGPSGTLFGGALTTFGGLINIVTKKPIDTTGGEISYTGGSYNLNRLTADVYGPVNKNKTLFARVNAAYTRQSSWQDAGFSRSTFIAPVILYRASDRLTLNFGAEIYHFEGTNPLSVFLNRTRQLVARNPSELHYDWNRSFTSNDITIKTPTVNIHGQATYKLSDSWTAQSNFSRSFRKSNGFYQYVMARLATDDRMERYVSLQNSNSYSTDLQQNFIGDFKIGSLRNRIVAGLDYLNQVTNNDNSPYITFDTVSGVSSTPSYIQLNRSAVEAKLAATTLAPTKTNTTSNVYSAYVSDVFNITDALLVMASLRVDRFESKGTYNQATQTIVANTKYGQTALSPKFGLVYQVVKDQVAIFGNYMNAFRNVAPVTQPLAEVPGTFKPQQANQVEGGVKLDLFHKKLMLTASYYNIEVNNVTRTEEYVKDNTSYIITVQNGTQLSKGIELDLVANPLPGLNLIAGYSHNDSKLTKSSPALEGRRPTSAGPADLVNAWISYVFPQGTLKGFGLGFGGNYAGENIVTNSAPTGIFTIPAYTVLNSSIFYNTRCYRIGITVNNLANKAYFKGWTTVEPQMPRQLLANISYKF